MTRTSCLSVWCVREREINNLRVVYNESISMLLDLIWSENSLSWSIPDQFSVSVGRTQKPNLPFFLIWFIIKRLNSQLCYKQTKTFTEETIRLGLFVCKARSNCLRFLTCCSSSHLWNQTCLHENFCIKKKQDYKEVVIFWGSVLLYKTILAANDTNRVLHYVSSWKSDKSRFGSYL